MMKQYSIPHIPRKQQFQTHIGNSGSIQSKKAYIRSQGKQIHKLHIQSKKAYIRSGETNP